MINKILVPSFAQGCEATRAFIWPTSEPLGIEEASAALKKVFLDVDRFINRPTAHSSLHRMVPQGWNV
jgi:hypothetical protein